jgi:spore coat protein U-like protein
MKIVKNSLVAAIALLTSSAAFAQATTTANFSVSASVLAFCKVSANNIVIAPITAGDTTGPKSSTGGVSVNCTNATTYTLGVPATLTLGLAGGGFDIPSTLAIAAPSGTGAGFGAGKVQSHTVTATIQEAAYENARAGNYSATTTVTLTY